MRPLSMRPLPLLLAVSSLGLALAACQNAKPGGLYSGTLSSTTGNATYSVVGAVTEDGALQLLSTTPSAGTQYSGQIVTSPSKTTGTASLRLYDASGAYVTTGSFKGNLGIRTQITGAYTADNGDRGNISLTYSAQHATPQTVEAAAGSYRWTSTRNGQAATLTLEDSGAITGITEYGCPFTGAASVLDSKYDLFTLSLTTDGADTRCNQTNSATGITYGGLAWYTPATSGAAATLTTAATTDAYGTYAIYQRQ